MARVIYVDSGYFIALLDSTDGAHVNAFRLHDTYYTDPNFQFVTTRDVLNEVLAHFSRSIPESKQGAASFAKDLFANPKYRIVVANDPEYLQALNLYENRLDKRYSMVDCLGMTLMHEQNIHLVFATDRDFEQEGFNNLMRRNR